MTQTPTEQTPSECKHSIEKVRKFFVELCCEKGENKNARCGYCVCQSVCPDYEPKEKKDGSN